MRDDAGMYVVFSHAAEKQFSRWGAYPPEQ